MQVHSVHTSVIVQAAAKQLVWDFLLYSFKVELPHQAFGDKAVGEHTSKALIREVRNFHVPDETFKLHFHRIAKAYKFSK